jgi:ribosomal protein S18 acetylase RimI-like enzyme
MSGDASETATIRLARLEDAETIAQFNIAMAWETERLTLDAETARAGVRAVFQQPCGAFYLLAQLGDAIAGALMVTTEWSDWRNGVFWWIQSVYIRPEFRRRGLYRALYGHVKAMASRQGNVRGFRLYVERENRIAQEAYRSLGMGETAYRIFEEKADH